MRLTKRARQSGPGYYGSYASQVGALGIGGQRRLRLSTALIVGAGRVGHAVALTLATSGIGRLIMVDPQRVSATDLNRCPTARPADVDRLKVDTTAAVLQGRPFLEVVPLVGRAEELDAMPDIDAANIVVSSCNTTRARIAVADFAADRQIPHVSAAVTDARLGFGGFVVGWSPSNRDLACPACFLTRGGTLPRDEALLSPVTAVVASTAAWYVMTLLTRGRRLGLHQNCVSIDLRTVTMEGFRTVRRPDCPSCWRGRTAESDGSNE